MLLNLFLTVIPFKYSVEAHARTRRKASSKQPGMLFDNLYIYIAYCLLATAASRTSAHNTTKASSNVATMQGMLSTNFRSLT
jgi:hypothetical protein